uniref:Glycosyl transferase family 1 domain-containing protein n=1 Tax=uncultured Alphaproteobacteria bacterium TaxID=91750 RepID=A0A6G8F3L9_9PROT|nr:hypothetical protein PlAlph_5530 [uncultured Alphaproteobacteria bacterium]
MTIYLKKLFYQKKGNKKKYKLLGIPLLTVTKTPAKKTYKIAGIKIAKKTPLNYQMQKQNKAMIKEYLNFLCQKDCSTFVPPLQDISEATSKIDAKIIAFYLPQYHTIPLNDKAYGKGFTEWHNVSKTFPYYTGHYQPHIPYDVGFYDLSIPKVMYRQVELAKQYGIDGFCFHYYWFNGQRLLETPIFNWLKNKDLYLPFCLCWANENWSKLWDGGDKEIIMPQQHKEQDDDNFFKDILPFFKDKRYITINNKPLFILYKPGLFEKEHLIKFRHRLDELCRKNGFAGIYFCIVYSSGTNPDEYAGIFDAVIEFPPHQMKNLKQIDYSSKYILPELKCQIFDIANYINEIKYIYPVSHKTFKTVFPSWDNSARKAFTNGYIFHGSTPNLYKKWLSGCINWEKRNNPVSERFVFVNAWNEWAEGAHMEPDVQNGYAYLQANREVYEKKSLNMLLISHDMAIAGASLSLYGIAKILRAQGHSVTVYSLLHGPLEQSFQEQHIPVTILSSENADVEKMGTYDLVICNTVLTYQFVKKCMIGNIPYLWYIREAAEISDYCKKYKGLSDVLKTAKITTVSEYAKSYILPYNSNVSVIHNFVEDTYNGKTKKNKKIQFTIVGYFTPRKAFHICIDAFLALDKNLSGRAVLNIVGSKSKNTSSYWRPLQKKTKNCRNIIWHDELQGEEKARLFEQTDIFVVPSFDESCSRIVLEAAMYGKPCIISENIGARYMIDDTTGWITKTGDSDDLRSVFQTIISKGYNAEEMGKAARNRYLTTSTPQIYQNNLQNIITESLENAINTKEI